MRLEPELEERTLKRVQHTEVSAADAPVGCDFTLELLRRLRGPGKLEADHLGRARGGGGAHTIIS